jgi:hypothetical protein
MEALGTARLAEEIPAGRAISTVVPRAAIMEALEGRDEAPELVLDLTKRCDGNEERGSVAIGFTPDDLERLLAEATGDGVILTFDGEDLARAFDDVEAHGFRERALVLAVAAAGAVGTSAAIANAAPMPISQLDGPQPAATAPAQVSDAASGGGYTAPASPADSMVTDASSAGGYTGVSGTDRMVTDASSGAGYAAQGAAADSMVTDASSGAGYAAQGGAADSMVTDVSSAGGYAAASAGGAADSMVTDASSGAGYAPPAAAASAADAMRTDVSSAGGYGAGVGTTGELSGPMLHVGGATTTDELLIGGALLAIAGAAFAAKRQTGSPRPA